MVSTVFVALGAGVLALILIGAMRTSGSANRRSGDGGGDAGSWSWGGDGCDGGGDGGGD